MNRRATRLSVLAVVALALVLRVAAATYWHRVAEQEGHLFRLGDSHSYWVLASQLARGLPYQYGSPEASIFRAPLYPLVLAPCTLIAEEQSAVWAARMVGCMLGTIAVGLVMLLAHRLGGRRAMLLAGLLAAIYPGAIGMSIVILSEAVFCPLMLAYLGLWQVAWHRDWHRTALVLGVAAGCVCGLAILARPSWLLFTPMLLAAGMLLGPRRARHATILCGTLIGIALTMSPWWYRNASITGEFVLTTLQVGPSLYDGLHVGASGGSDEGMEFMAEFTAQQRAEDSASANLRSTMEFRLNRRAQQAAIAWLKSHPREALLLAWQKFLRTWSLWPNGGELGSATLRAALTIGCFTIVALAILGSFQSTAKIRGSSRSTSVDRWTVHFYWLPAVYFTGLHMLFVGSIRYREPAVLVLTILGGLGLAKLSAWMSPPRTEKTSIGLAAARLKAHGSASNDRTGIERKIG